jgi:uncharacterized protein
VLTLCSSAFAATNPARQAAQKRGTEPPVDGVWYVYDRNGALVREENYQSYRLHGEVRDFYPSGSVKATANYIDGYRQGPGATYYENGQLQSTINYEDNNLNGLSQRFYDTGELESEVVYVNGNLDGPKKTYYKSGSRKQVLNYVDGKLHGSVRTYDEQTGDTLTEENYKHGSLVGRKDYKAEILETTVPEPALKSAKPQPKKKLLSEDKK